MAGDGQGEASDFYGRYVYQQEVFPVYMRRDFIADKAQSIREMLALAGLEGRLPELDCMDVGMGRQALCLALMGARSVAHFDISASQQRRFAAHLAQNFPGLPITSQRLDICQQALGRERFDFILLEGVIHHTAHVARALVNCLHALRPGGRMWLMFYRSGCFHWFVCSMARLLLAGEPPGRFLDFAAQWCGQRGLRDYKSLMNMVDDLCVPHVQLFTPFSYAAFLEAWGCQVYGGRGLELLRSVDHAALPDHGALIAQKMAGPLREPAAGPPDWLDPGRAVDQLDPGLYLDPGPLGAIQCLRQVEPDLKAQPDRRPVYRKAILLHQLASPSNWDLPPAAPDYDQLERILRQ